MQVNGHVVASGVPVIVATWRASAARSGGS